MQRVAKKSLYGLVYITILGLVGFGLYTKYFGPPPATCQDGILNQDEEEVDCGGACQSCELKNLELEIGGVRTIETGENTATFLVKFENPSDNYGALDIPYVFKYSDENSIPATIEGRFSVEPGELGYVSEPGVSISPFGAAVSFGIGEFDFIEAEDIPVYQVGIRGLEVTFPEDVVQVSGTLINDSSAPIRQIKILILFKDSSGDIVSTAETLSDNLGAFDRRDLLIRAPRSNEFIDPDKTEVFYEVIN